MSPFKIILSFVLLAVLGIVFVPRLPIELLPNNDLPVLTVRFSLLDAPPSVIEKQATAPLENVLSQLSQLKRIYSVSGYENGTIELTFDQEVDIAFKKFEVNSIVRNVYNKLNTELTYPIVEQQARENKTKSPLLVYRISARLEPFQIKKEAEDKLITILSQKNGVQDVLLRGAEELQLSIVYDYESLQQYGISVHDITSQIQTEFTTFYPGALLTSGEQRFTIKGGHTPKDIAQIENAMIQSAAGNFIPLKKIARIYYEESKPRQYFRINGLNSITLSIFSDDRINRLALAEDIKKQMNSLQSSLPQGYSVIQDYDDTEFLDKEINKNVFRCLLSLFMLLVFLVVTYRSLKHLLVLFSGILISLGLTALAVSLLGFQIHLYTIAGITISLGIIIDNSIVVLDHLRTKGDKKILIAVLGSALTTISALLLVFFLPEGERQNLTEFCGIVSIAIACSVVTAIFYTPTLYSLFPSANASASISFTTKRRKVSWFTKYNTLIMFVSGYRKTFLILCLLVFGIPVFLLPSKWENHDLYNKVIGGIIYQETIKPVTDKILGGALRLFVRNVYDRSGYREVQRTQLYIQTELPFGNTLEDMNRVIQGMERYLSTVKGIEKYIAQVYSGQHAVIVISFEKNVEKGSLPFILKSRLIARSFDWGGVKWNIYGVGEGFSNDSFEGTPSFNIKMKGYNYDALAGYAESMARKLLQHERIQKVNTNERLSWDEKTTEQLALNFARTTYGSPTTLVSQLYEKAEHTTPSFPLVINDQLFPVYLKPNQNKISTHELFETHLITSDSLHLKLSSIASLRKEITSNAIHKEDRQYIRIVGFEYNGNSQFGNQYLDKVLAQMKKEMPVGYSANKNSWNWNWKKVKRQYGLVLLLSISIYFIASILFENLKQPLYIVLTIPFSFVGLFLIFALFDFYFDQGGYAAFILLGGLTVNASIYIVNDLNNSMNKNRNRSVMKAVTGKMKPIVLTVVSTCLGLLPFMIGGQNEVFWFALAAGTTGGLIFSLLVVFLFLPVLLVKK